MQDELLLNVLMDDLLLMRHCVCRISEDGKETIMSYENDVLKSKTVNGVPESITYC